MKIGEKKLRGKKRIFRNILKLPKTFQAFFPSKQENPQYWHFHIPLPVGFISIKRGKRKILLKIIESLLSTCITMTRNKPKTVDFVKVVLILNLNNIADSQIVVFFSENYYSNFFKRNSLQQKWIPLPEVRSLLKEWGISEKYKLPELGFQECIDDEDGQYQSELWMYGDVPKI